MPLSVVILAAGRGTRMRSLQPKVLTELAGRPLLQHVIDTARELNPSRILVVVGHGRQQITAAFATEPVQWIEQAEQKGTGHAVQQAMADIADDDQVLILYGDVPLTSCTTLQAVTSALRHCSLCLLTATLEDPIGYGRILRDANGKLIAIVEHRDADAAQRRIREINTGILAAKAQQLGELLGQLRGDNAQGEYYLTDIIALGAKAGLAMTTSTLDNIDEISGVNDHLQLARLERAYQARLANQLMRRGIALRDPARIDIRGTLDADVGTVIDVNCVFIGHNKIGKGVRIGPNCTISDSQIDDHAVIEANTIIENARIGERCSVGPFARVRPATVLEKNARLGNFVEVKNSHIGSGSKVNHLSYVGDSDVAQSVNIGAGVITANYDGASKHRTIIEEDAFIGSNSVLIAPIRIGKSSTIGAGTTVSVDTSEKELVITRARVKKRTNWQRPQKRK